MSNIDKLIIDSDYGRNYIEPNLKNDASTRWKEKKVFESITLFNGTNIQFLEVNRPFDKLENGISVKTNTSCSGRNYRETIW